MPSSSNSIRLPPGVQPIRYDLHLFADPAKSEFRGDLKIQLKAAKATGSVTLHARGLKVSRATMQQTDQARACSIRVDKKAETVTFSFKPALERGKATLELEYDGKIAEGMAGLYLSKDGDEVCLATQCEATDARTILPCFDEPEYKAEFAWTVTAPKKHRVLTNGAQKSRKIKGALATTVFQATAPMSSYLVACVIGAFKATPMVHANGTPFAVWALGGKENLGTHGRDLAAEMLPWYETYFGQPYAFGKYDQVAIPSFAFGAMENAGLVTFRPSLILVNEKASSWGDRRDVALVVAHEFAHMWFGDLVTMAWWDDLWLNEAFAEWMAHKIVDAQHPELDVWNRFRARAAGALSTDTLDSTHAIYHPIRTPAEAAEMFDAITYGKGSAVMRMLEAYLGENAFRAGLRSYMKEFQFANATGADLWRHLSKASKQDVAAIMKDWIRQPGHPAVQASWKGQLQLTQRRAKASPVAQGGRQRWRVPMVIRYEDDRGVHVHNHLLTKTTENVHLPSTGLIRWIWPNAFDVGFYQSPLDDALLANLLRHESKITPEEKISLLRDLWLQVRAGERKVGAYLHALQQLADGRARYDIVQQVVGHLRGAERLLEAADKKEAVQSLRQWIAKRFAPAYQELGLQPTATEDDPTRERRAALLRAMAAIAREPAAVAHARELAERERENPAAVDATLSGTAVAAEALNGNGKTLSLHLATYKARRTALASPQDVERYLYVLPAFREPAVVQRVLDTLNKGGVAPQAVGPILRAMLMEPHSQRLAWKFLQTHWATLKKSLGESWMANLVEACGELPADLADAVVKFLSAKLKGSAGQAFGRAQERLQHNAELSKRLLPELESWALALDSATAN